MSRIHLPFGRGSFTARSLVFIFVVIALHTLCDRSLAQVGPQGGRNVNMVSGTSLPDGDPFRQRQDEPAVAISTRNLQHLLAGANDYRTVDLPGVPNSEEHGDAW